MTKKPIPEIPSDESGTPFTTAEKLHNLYMGEGWGCMHQRISEEIWLNRWLNEQCDQALIVGDYIFLRCKVDLAKVPETQTLYPRFKLALFRYDEDLDVPTPIHVNIKGLVPASEVDLTQFYEGFNGFVEHAAPKFLPSPMPNLEGTEFTNFLMYPVRKQED